MLDHGRFRPQAGLTLPVYSDLFDRAGGAQRVLALAENWPSLSVEN